VKPKSREHAGQSRCADNAVTVHLLRGAPLTPHGWLADITAHDDHRRMSGRAPVKRVPKPWGHETIWALTEDYVGKILHISAGEALSVQYHEVKDETVYLLSGELIYRIWEDDQPRDVQLEIGQAYRITPGTVHQMEAVTDCDILEVSTPQLDDVVRLKDRYGREGTNAP
jgi:mannose-6-phosphate isomerase